MISRQGGGDGEGKASRRFGCVTEPVLVKGQDACNSGTERAGERGGARMGKPRRERILSITGGFSMAVVILEVPAKTKIVVPVVSDTLCFRWRGIRVESGRLQSAGWGGLRSGACGSGMASASDVHLWPPDNL